jgi:hypothetical protein
LSCNSLLFQGRNLVA